MLEDRCHRVERFATRREQKRENRSTCSGARKQRDREELNKLIGRASTMLIEQGGKAGFAGENINESRSVLVREGRYSRYFVVAGSVKKERSSRDKRSKDNTSEKGLAKGRTIGEKLISRRGCRCRTWY